MISTAAAALVVIPLTSRADQLDDLKLLQAKCEDTRQSCENTLQLTKAYSKEQEDIIRLQRKDIADLSKGGGNLFSSPTFYMLVGVVAGVFLTRSK